MSDATRYSPDNEVRYPQIINSCPIRAIAVVRRAVKLRAIPVTTAIELRSSLYGSWQFTG